MWTSWIPSKGTPKYSGTILWGQLLSRWKKSKWVQRVYHSARTQSRYMLTKLNEKMLSSNLHVPTYLFLRTVYQKKMCLCARTRVCRRWGKSKFTDVNTQNIEFIILLLFIYYYITFNMNNYKPTYFCPILYICKSHSQASEWTEAYIHANKALNTLDLP